MRGTNKTYHINQAMHSTNSINIHISFVMENAINVSTDQRVETKKKRGCHAITVRALKIVLPHKSSCSCKFRC